MEKGSNSSIDEPGEVHSADTMDSQKFKVYLWRKNGPVKISNKMNKMFMNPENMAINHFISWISAAMYSLDIILFNIMHPEIINALINKQESGVRVRIIVDIFWLQAMKNKPNEKYFDMLLESGIHFCWVNYLNKPVIFRLILIDCTDPKKRPDKFGFDCAVIMGKLHSSTAPDYKIDDDVRKLMIVKGDSAAVQEWSARFNELWDFANRRRR